MVGVEQGVAEGVLADGIVLAHRGGRKGQGYNRVYSVSDTMCALNRRDDSE